jgi:uncharacterized UPF0160 family protein
VKVFRIQDRSGRGPFRPGFSKQWLDEKMFCTFPSWIEEFGLDWMNQKIPGEHYGCGCRTIEKLHQWFSQSERAKLEALGYVTVELSVDRVIAESENQILFARFLPLKEVA